MSLTDLPDAPLTDPLAEALRFADACLDLAEDEPTAYAADTLTGIAATVRKTGRVTEAQRTAVDNIVAGAERAREGLGRWGRRYEGWKP